VPMQANLAQHDAMLRASIELRDRIVDKGGIFQLEDWDDFYNEDYYEITDMVFSPDSKFLAFITENPNNSMIEEGFGVLSEQKGFTTSMGYSPGYPWNFASGSSNGTITLWNKESHDNNIEAVLVGNGEPVWTLAFFASGKFLASTGNNGFAQWDILASPPLLMGEESGSEISTIAPFINSVPETISCVSGDTSTISDDGLWTASSVCFDISRERELGRDMPCSRSNIPLMGQNVSYTPLGFYGMVTTLAFSPDGKILVAGICRKFDYRCYSGEIIL
jgi:WD40 repeat protein